jgi:hypothetical protein
VIVMRHCAIPAIRDKTSCPNEANGAVVIDLTKPGWMVTEANVESLKSELVALSSMEDVAIIFDLFGNTSYRFQHVDGSLVLPFRVGGGHHLLGDIHMFSDSGIGDLINMVKPLFVFAALFFTVIMPPPSTVRFCWLLQGKRTLNQCGFGWVLQ